MAFSAIGARGLPMEAELSARFARSALHALDEYWPIARRSLELLGWVCGFRLREGPGSGCTDGVRGGSCAKWVRGRGYPNGISRSGCPNGICEAKCANGIFRDNADSYVLGGGATGLIFPHHHGVFHPDLFSGGKNENIAADPAGAIRKCMAGDFCNQDR